MSSTFFKIPKNIFPAKKIRHCEAAGRGNPPEIPETLGDCHVGLRPPRNDEVVF